MSKDKQSLHEIISYVKNGDNKLNVCVLFNGGSNGEKTMSAKILSDGINLPLYRIDLSTIVNKYIYETEKNLDEIFDKAGVESVLFFDEADALFGKRTKINNAHDRYANIEIEYLLQRIESYKGLVILATNMKNSLDDAFMRRMRFVVNFPFPDENRKNVWKNNVSSGSDTNYSKRKKKPP